MTAQTSQILEKALSLSAKERIALAEKILLSLEAPEREIDELWAHEAEDRLDAFYQKKVKAIPAKEVFKI